MIRKWKKFPFSWLLPVLFFAALWLLGTTGIYNDSNQYIAMHIHREPLYSFFLWIFRSLFGETKYLDIVRFLQNGLAAFSVIWLAESLKKRFDFGQWMEALVCLILLAPHIITPVFSASGLVLSNGVISEALGLPLFYLFTAQCMKMVYTRQRGAALSSLLLSLFLSLVRGQMMFTILLWLVFAGAVVIVEKKKLAKRLLICVVCTALAFGTRTLLVKSYNLVFNGYFINNTFGSVGLLANILYASDEEDAERIADQDARVMFELSYRLAKEQGATYQDAPEGFFNRAAHLEKWHDAIKFEMIEEPWRQLHDREGFIDYIPENVESDRIAATIVKSLLPAVLGRWLYDYLALACYGLIRSIAVVHPLLNWYALTAYLAYIVLAALAWRKNHNSNAVWLAAFSLLAVLANVFATSMIIMCLSRYVIYGLPLFYVSGLMLLYELAGGKTAGELKH
jgi:membrane protein